MLRTGVCGFVSRCAKKCEVDLKRSIRQKTNQLCFCRDFCRHEVEDGELDIDNGADWQAYVDGMYSLGLEDWVATQGIEEIAK